MQLLMEGPIFMHVTYFGFLTSAEAECSNEINQRHFQFNLSQSHPYTHPRTHAKRKILHWVMGGNSFGTKPINSDTLSEWELVIIGACMGLDILL